MYFLGFRPSPVDVWWFWDKMSGQFYRPSLGLYWFYTIYIYICMFKEMKTERCRLTHLKCWFDVAYKLRWCSKKYHGKPFVLWQLCLVNDGLFLAKLASWFATIIAMNQHFYVEVSYNGGTPKWMVYNGKSIYKWMIGGYPYFRKPPYLGNCESKFNTNGFNYYPIAPIESYLIHVRWSLYQLFDGQTWLKPGNLWVRTIVSCILFLWINPLISRLATVSMIGPSGFTTFQA